MPRGIFRSEQSSLDDWIGQRADPIDANIDDITGLHGNVVVWEDTGPRH